MPKPGIPDSTCKFFPDSGFYKHKLPGLGRSGLKERTRDAGCRKQPSGRDDGIGPLFNGQIDLQIESSLEFLTSK